MAVRRRSPKGDARRARILDLALEFVARRGYRASTIRELAEAAGVSKTGLLHHFETREQLFAEVLRRRDTAGRSRIEERAGPAVPVTEWLPATARDNLEVPGLVELYTRLAAEATEPGHPAHEFFDERYRRMRSLVATQLEQLRSDGGLPDGVEPHRLAAVLLAAQDGLQVQWLYDRDLDMVGALADLVACLRLDPTGAEPGRT